MKNKITSLSNTARAISALESFALHLGAVSTALNAGVEYYSSRTKGGPVNAERSLLRGTNSSERKVVVARRRRKGRGVGRA